MSYNAIRRGFPWQAGPPQGLAAPTAPFALEPAPRAYGAPVFNAWEPWIEIVAGALAAVATVAIVVLTDHSASKKRSHYRYFLYRRRGMRRKPGITIDPDRRLRQHRRCWRRARMRVVGPPVTRTAALAWENQWERKLGFR